MLRKQDKNCELACRFSVLNAGVCPTNPTLIFLLFCSSSMRFIEPMRLLKRPFPFDHPDWIFELKYDGFRALAVIENGGAHRNGHAFASFAELGKEMRAALPDVRNTVLDGEIVCVDSSGRPQFEDLLFHRGDPCFFAFDLLIREGRDHLTDPARRT